jgi:hypothetical protein
VPQVVVFIEIVDKRCLKSKKIEAETIAVFTFVNPSRTTSILVMDSICFAVVLFGPFLVGGAAMISL